MSEDPLENVLCVCCMDARAAQCSAENAALRRERDQANQRAVERGEELDRVAREKEQQYQRAEAAEARVLAQADVVRLALEWTDDSVCPDALFAAARALRLDTARTDTMRKKSLSKPTHTWEARAQEGRQ